MMNAVENGDLDMVKALVEAGADINPRPESYKNVLLMVAVKNDMDLIRYYLDKGQFTCHCIA